MAGRYAGFDKLKGHKKKPYKLPLPPHGWRGGGERSVDEGPPVPPNKRHPRGRDYSPQNRPN